MEPGVSTSAGAANALDPSFFGERRLNGTSPIVVFMAVGARPADVSRLPQQGGAA